MSLKSINTAIPEYEVPYYPFPKNPSLIRHGNEYAYKYLEPFEVGRIIKEMATKIKFSEYDAVLVNMQGGYPLFKDLALNNGFTGKPIQIEYHRPDSGVGSNIVIPVPDYLIGKKCLVVWV